mgnify:CR=1 FL=1
MANRGGNYVNVEDALDVIRGFSLDAGEECSSPANGHGLTVGRILLDCLISRVFTEEIYECIMCFLLSLSIVNLGKVLGKCLYASTHRPKRDATSARPTVKAAVLPALPVLATALAMAVYPLP